MSIARFWRETPSRYNLIGSECTNCGRKYFPPRIVCEVCHRESIGKMKNYEFSGSGKLLSYTRVHDGPFKLQVPYLLGIVELEEGARVTAQLVDCKEPKIGMKLKATFRKISEESKSGVIYYGYKFKPER